jgi:Uncharacterized protein conserved in bacteria (DUF2252)
MPRNDPQKFRPNQRVKILSRVRNLKMARNAHAYVRGSTEKFYEWLKTAGSNALQYGFAAIVISAISDRLPTLTGVWFG